MAEELEDQVATAHTLRFESPEKVYGLPPGPTLYSSNVGPWRVREVYRAGGFDHVGPGLGTYRLVMEQDVATPEQVSDAVTEACQLAEELDTAWCYVIGRPFLALGWTWALREAPDHWTGNSREVDVALREARQTGYAVAMQVYSPPSAAWLPFPPLERAMAVRAAYLAAPEAVRGLIELHIQSHKSSRGELFLLAKALEVVGKFFGDSRAARNTGLQAEMATLGVSPYLTRTAEWLFETANTRFDVRHAVDRGGPGVTLYPRMTDAERRDFWNNTDLIVRAFVCQQLGVALPLPTLGGSPPAVGAP